MDAGGEKSLARAAGAVSGATMISRVLGLAREAMIAALFGAGIETDAFNIAFRIPNMLRDLFAEGALSAAFVPTFTATLSREGREEAWRLANAVIGVLMMVLGVVTLLIFAGATPLVVALAPGFRTVEGKVGLAADLSRIMSPFLLFVALAAVMMGLLNVFGKFFLPALAPAVFNAVNIAVTLSLYPIFVTLGVTPAYALALGALIGVIAQFAVQIPAARRLGFSLRPRLRASHPGVRRMAVLMLPATIGLAATQMNILIDSQFASQWAGAVSWLQYAFRLMYLPIGLVGVAIGTVNLARVSTDAASGNLDALRRRVAGSVRLTLALALPATAGLIALREPIVRVLFERGRFDMADTTATSRVLLAYALGLSAYSCLKVVVPTFYALGDTRTPVKVSFLSVGIKVVSSFALVPFLQYQGLALSTAIVASLNVLILWYALSRRLGGFSGLGVVPSALRSAASATVMGLACATLWPQARAAVGGGRLMELLLLLSFIGLGLSLTLLLARILGIEELMTIARGVSARLGRGKRE